MPEDPSAKLWQHPLRQTLSAGDERATHLRAHSSIGSRLCLTDSPGFNPHGIPAGGVGFNSPYRCGYDFVSPPSHPGADAALGPSAIHQTEPRRRTSERCWGEIAVTSNHSFLSGASHPEELVHEAARLGHAGIALTDFETFGGAVRAHVAAREIHVGDRGGPQAGERLRLAHGVRMRFSVDDVPSVQSVDGHALGKGVWIGDGQTVDLLLYPTDRASWGALCRLLTKARTLALQVSGDETRIRGNLRPEDRRRRLPLHDLVELLHEPRRGGDGLLAVLCAPQLPSQRVLEAAEGLSRLMPDRFAVALTRVDDPESAAESERSCVLADVLDVPVVASSDVRMHALVRKPLLDTLACIRDGVCIDRASRQVALHAERRLRPVADIMRRYADRPDALETAWRFLDRAAAFSLEELRYEYPDEVVPQGMPPMRHLRGLVWRGARERYPRGVPAKVARQFEHEFAIIDDLGYAPYFLTVHDIVAFARSRGILCQGRGAAANSAVCYALGVTAVDPDRIDVLFERFVSRERNEPPDIDIDFEHERREEVIQHVYAKYGRDRAALVCEVISYRGRSAVRDVGKALGFAPDTIDRLANEVDRWGGGGLGVRDDVAGGSFDVGVDHGLPESTGSRLRAAGLDPEAPRVRALVQLVGELLGFPRHRSQHVGGFVISRSPLSEIVPIEQAAMQDRTIIEWDKDDIEALGMLKIDLLSLGMLTALRKGIDLVNGDRAALGAGGVDSRLDDAPPVRRDLADVSPLQQPSRPAVSVDADAGLGAHVDATPLVFHAIPSEDPAAYDMICKADTVGVFQIESRAQMSMLPRLKPRRFYDLVIEVAIVRPGPIQGDMVHPYLRRRNGEEPIVYPSDAIRTVLGKTLGVPLFQEQAMALAVVAAGFTAGQADELRRAIAAWKRSGNKIAMFGEALEGGMIARGYTREFAQQVFQQIKGFSGYGFPESHAASFAHLVYASAWLKRRHPAAFTTALLNSQPMGFYAPAQLLRDAKDHGVAVRGVDVHCSRWDSTLERGPDPSPWIAAPTAPARTLFEGFGTPIIGDERRLAQDAAVFRIDGASVEPRIERLDRSGCSPLRWHAVRARAIEHGVGPSPSAHMRTVLRRVHSRGRSMIEDAWTCVDDVSTLRHTHNHAAIEGYDGTRESPRCNRPGRRPEPLCAPSAPARHPPDAELRQADFLNDSPPSDSRHGAEHFLVPSQSAIRLGLRMVRGLDPEEAHRVVEAVVRHGPFRSIADLAEASEASQATLRKLAAADAFGSMALDRQQAIWQIMALRDRERPLWSFGTRSDTVDAGAEQRPGSACTGAGADSCETEPALPPVTELSAIARDFESTGVTLKRHPLACLRDQLQKLRIIPCGHLRDEQRAPTGKRVRVAGLVLVRQRPSTAKGIVFMTIEDESGVANLIFRPKVYERLRPSVRGAVLLAVGGKVERRDGVVHVLVQSARDLSGHLVTETSAITTQSRDYR
jgi:error-prone DNA polymerase